MRITILSSLFLVANITCAQSPLEKMVKEQPNVNYSEIINLHKIINSDIGNYSDKDRKFSDRFAHYNLQRYLTPNGKYDPSIYNKGLKFLTESGNYCTNSIFSDWKPIGISNVGQHNALVSAVWMHPENENILLMGGNKYGIFKSRNQGENWYSVTDNLPYPVLGVKQILHNPNNPNELLAFTGNRDIQDNILHSIDSGESWSSYNKNVENDTEDLNFALGYQFNPQNNSELFVFNETSIYKTVNFGENYSKIDIPELVGFKIDDFVLTNTFAYLSVYSSNVSQNECKRRIVKLNLNNINPFIEFVSLNLFNDELLKNHNFNEQITTITELYTVTDPDPLDPTKYNYETQQNPYQFHLKWFLIRTEGWPSEIIDNNTDLDDETDMIYEFGEPLRCKFITNKDKEVGLIYKSTPNTVGNSVNNSINHAVVQMNESNLIVKANIPKGLKLTLAYFIGNEISNGSAANPSFTLEGLNNFDYTSLFNNKIYESNFSINNQEIDNIFPINGSSFPDIGNNGNILYVYAIVEKNSDYNGIDNLELFNFSFTNKNENMECPKTLRFSNYNPSSSSFYIDYSKNGDYSYSRLFKTDNNGMSFNIFARTIGFGVHPGVAKSELVQSIKKKNFVYQGLIKSFYQELGNVFNQRFDNNVSTGFHDDIRASCLREINGTEYLLIGNDGGIALTENFSTDMRSLNGNLSTGDIYTLDVHPTNGNIIAGLQDNSTFVYNKINNQWTLVPGTGDGSLTYYHPGQGDRYIYGDPQHAYGVTASINMFEEVGMDIMEDELPDITLTRAFLGMDVKAYRYKPDKFYSGLNVKGENESDPNNHNYYSGLIINRSEQQTELHTFYNKIRQVNGIGICEKDLNTVYIGDGNSYNNFKIYKSTDEAVTFNLISNNPVVQEDQNGNSQEVSPSLNAFIYSYGITDIDVLADDANTFFFTINQVATQSVESSPGEYVNQPIEGVKRVMMSDDGGLTFKDYSTGLPSLPANKIISIDDTPNNLLFVGTDAGVYYRTKEMESWECFSNNLPMAQVTDLEFDYCNKELYVSTYGRGIFKTKIPFDIFNRENASEITSNTTWNTDTDIEGSVRVKTGNTLTIENCLISFKADQRIIVEKGAKLRLLNAHLTSTCDAFWYGVEVLGNPEEHQYNNNQGSVFMNNATLENSRGGIALWEVGNWSTMGGYVIAENSTFKNNRRSASFLPYDNYHPSNGSPVNNRSRFTNCNFVWDDDHFMENPAPSITMYKVEGVLISRCNFEDNRTTNRGNGEGIFTIDAKYKVLGAPNSLSNQVVAYYETDPTQSIYTPNRFVNLKYGVHVLNANSQNSVTVDHSEFLNCKYGIYASAVDDAMFTRNYFSNGVNSPIYPISMYLEKSSAYQVEGNVFEDTHNSQLSTAFVANNSGVENNQVFKNKISNYAMGSYALNVNKNVITNPNETYKGLEYNCNDFVMNDFADMYVNGFSAVDGIKVNQGSLAEAAGNRVTQSSLSIGQLGNSANNEIVNYYYYEDEAFEELTSFQGPVNVVSVEEGHKCFTNFNFLSIKPSKPLNIEKKNFIINKFYQEQNEYAQLQAQYKNMLAGNTTTQRDLDYKRAVVQQKYKEMNLNANWILKDIVQDSLPIDSSEYVQWILNRDDLLKELQWIDFNLQKGNKTLVVTALNSLSTQVNTPRFAQVKQELMDYIVFKQHVLLESNAKGVLEGVSPAFANKLRLHASNAVGTAKYQAQNLLCFFLNECVEPVLSYPQGKSSVITNNNEQEESTQKDGIKVYPNPAKEALYLEVPTSFLKYSYTFMLYGTDGKLMMTKELEQLQEKIDVTGLKKGMYIIKITSDTQQIATQKLIIE